MLLFSSCSLSSGPVLPLIIFTAEMIVVTLSTIRIIFVSRGVKGLAALMGFFEVSIWLYAIGQTMQNLGDLRCSAAFACGFTLGNYLGVLIHEKMALGHLGVRIITSKDTEELLNILSAADYGVTCVDAQGVRGPVRMLLTVIKKRDLGQVLRLIKQFDSKVFYSISDLHSTGEGIFPLPAVRTGGLLPAWLPWTRRMNGRVSQVEEDVLTYAEPVTP